jgi:hypothetical protein
MSFFPSFFFYPPRGGSSFVWIAELSKEKPTMFPISLCTYASHHFFLNHELFTPFFPVQSDRAFLPSQCSEAGEKRVTATTHISRGIMLAVQGYIARERPISSLTAMIQLRAHQTAIPVTHVCLSRLVTRRSRHGMNMQVVARENPTAALQLFFEPDGSNVMSGYRHKLQFLGTCGD